jgi:hypothetical protein
MPQQPLKNKDLKFFQLLHLAIGKAFGAKEQTEGSQNENGSTSKKTHQDNSEDT